MPKLSPLTALIPLLLAPAALAWTPVLDAQTAQTAIHKAYRVPGTDPKPTFLSVNLAVEHGAFKTPGAVTVFDGGEACLSDWLSNPAAFTRGSQVREITATGQADAVYFEAVRANKAFKTLTAEQALSEEARAARLPDGRLRIDVKVAGLPSEEHRATYNVRLQNAAGEMLSPAQASYINNWKQGEDGKWAGTLVYYFDLNTAAGTPAFDPNGTVNLLLRNEQLSCAYSVPLNLGSFS